MKAYYLQVRDDDDQGQVVVFANTSKEAKKRFNEYDFFYDNYIDIQVLRASPYDGMEKLSTAELALEQWHNGWRWFDMNYPDPDEATDPEFIEWYNNNFGVRS
jgi:hypothetical protein